MRLGLRLRHLFAVSSVPPREDDGYEPHTDLIQLDGIELGSGFAQEGLGGFAVGAVGFGEYGCAFAR